MKKTTLLIWCLLILFSSYVLAYISPAYTTVDLVLGDNNYTSPNYTSVDLVLGVGATLPTATWLNLSLYNGTTQIVEELNLYINFTSENSVVNFTITNNSINVFNGSDWNVSNNFIYNITEASPYLLQVNVTDTNGVRASKILNVTINKTIITEWMNFSLYDGTSQIVDELNLYINFTKPTSFINFTILNNSIGIVNVINFNTSSKYIHNISTNGPYLLFANITNSNGFTGSTRTLNVTINKTIDIEWMNYSLYNGTVQLIDSLNLYINFTNPTPIINFTILNNSIVTDTVINFNTSNKYIHNITLTGQYLLSVNITGGNDFTGSSDILNVFINKTIDTPIITVPRNGKTISTVTPILEWLNDFQNLTLNYSIDVSDNSTFATINFSATTANLYILVNITLANNTIYYWRVNSSSGTLISEYATANFTTDTSLNKTKLLNSSYYLVDSVKNISYNGTAYINQSIFSTVTYRICANNTAGIIKCTSFETFQVLPLTINLSNFKVVSPNTDITDPFFCKSVNCTLNITTDVASTCFIINKTTTTHIDTVTNGNACTSPENLTHTCTLHPNLNLTNYYAPTTLFLSCNSTTVSDLFGNLSRNVSLFTTNITALTIINDGGKYEFETYVNFTIAAFGSNGSQVATEGHLTTEFIEEELLPFETDPFETNFVNTTISVNISEFVVKTFNDSTIQQSINFSQVNSSLFFIDWRSFWFLSGIDMAIEGVLENSLYPTDITISISNVTKRLYKGEIRNTSIVNLTSILKSIHSSENRANDTLLFETSSDSETFSMNVTADATFINFTFNISGASISPEAFTLIENFTNNSGVDPNPTIRLSTVTGDTPFFMFDDLQEDITDRWSTSGNLDRNEVDVVAGVYNQSTATSVSCSGTGEEHTSTETGTGWSRYLDLENFTRVNLTWSCSLSVSAGCWSNGGSSRSQASGSCYLKLTDDFYGSSGETVRSVSVSRAVACDGNDGDDSSGSGSTSGSVLLERQPSGVWKIDGSSSTGVLGDKVNILMEETSSTFCTQEWPVGLPTTALSTIKADLDKIELSGFAPTYINTTDRWNTSATLESEELFNTSENITGVVFDPEYTTESGTSIFFFVSADNGTTYEQLQDFEIGGFHSFLAENYGQNLKYKVNVTSTGSRKSFVYRVTIKVITGAPENITFDVGGDGTVDKIFTGVLNVTNSPQVFYIDNVSVNTYIQTFCTNVTQYCSVPFRLTSDSPGKFTADAYDFQQKVPSISLSASDFSTQCLVNGSCTLIVNISGSTGGLLNVNISKIFFGDRNTTIIATAGNTSTNNTITIRYSPFNKTLPIQAIDYSVYFDNPTCGGNTTSWLCNQSNVEPFGQLIRKENNTANETISRGIYNITTTAYSDRVDIFRWFNESPNECFKLETCQYANKTFCKTFGSGAEQSLMISDDDGTSEGRSKMAPAPPAANNKTLINNLDTVTKLGFVYRIDKSGSGFYTHNVTIFLNGVIIANLTPDNLTSTALTEFNISINNSDVVQGNNIIIFNVSGYGIADNFALGYDTNNDFNRTWWKLNQGDDPQVQYEHMIRFYGTNNSVPINTNMTRIVAINLTNTSTTKVYDFWNATQCNAYNQPYLGSWNFYSCCEGCYNCDKFKYLDTIS